MLIMKMFRKFTFPAAVITLCAGAAAFAQTATDEADEDDREVSAAGSAADPAPESGGDFATDEGDPGDLLIESDGGEEWIEPPSEREVQEEELRRLFEIYREALDNGDYLEADTLAKRVVELSIRLNGLDSHDSAKAITNLGIAQHNNAEFETAMQNFAAAIDIVERIDDNLSPALINPLRGLAATQAITGQPDLARLSYQRAVHISHVNEGPHNKDQIGILESVAELNLAEGEYDEATDIQEHIYAIQSRNVDPDSLDMIPALETRAEWQHRLQSYSRERVTWRRIIDIVEDHYGDEALELIAPLTNLGKTYLFVSPAELDYQPEVSASSGETYLRRANDIASEHPDSNWSMLEGTLLALGDYYILSGRPNRALTAYEETWNLLSEGDDADRLKARRDHLETIKVLQRVFPPKYYNSERTDIGQVPPDNFEKGTMSFSYTVSPTGRVVDLKHVETQPREIAEFRDVVGRTVRRQIYRPRMQEGQLTHTSDVIYTHEFYFRPSDLPAVVPAPAGEEQPAPEVATPES